jgi:hypothetical protein
VLLCNCSVYQQGAQRQRSRCASVTDASAQWMRQCCDTDDFENFVQDSIILLHNPLDLAQKTINRDSRRMGDLMGMGGWTRG